MLAVLRAMDSVEAGREISSATDVAAILAAAGSHLAERTRTVSDADGMAGFASCEPVEYRRQLRAFIGLRPGGGPGVAPRLLRWVEFYAARTASVRGWGESIAVTWQLPGSLAENALRARGWNVIRRYSRLTAPLVRPPAPAPLPPGVLVRAAIDDDHATQVHSVLEDALAHHFGHEPTTPSEFLASENGKAGHDRSLWLLATVAGSPAAAVVARRPPGRGWIGFLGTRPGFRGIGLARALLTRAMAQLARKGCTQVALDVDTGNEGGALRLYESVGFRVDYQADEWRHTTVTTHGPSTASGRGQ